MQEKKQINLGIVGCGDISLVHGNAVDSIGHARFSACADINEKRAREWSQKFSCDHYYTNYLDMISQEKLDGIVLATWPNQHLDQIEKCAASGIKNILCQKSLTLTGKEAKEIFRIVKENDLFLMEGFMYRHHPAITKLESILAQGEIGPVDYVRAVFNDFDAENESPDDENRNWRQRKESGGGIPYDFACYAINACGHFSNGLPVKVYASGGLSKKYGTINRLFGMIEYDNGCVGIVESSKKSSFSQELQISCANGILDLPLAWTIYDEVKISQTYRSDWAHVLNTSYGIQKTDSYKSEMENFVGVIEGITKPRIPIKESLINIFVIEALVTSLLERKTVEISIPEELKP